MAALATLPELPTPDISERKTGVKVIFEDGNELGVMACMNIERDVKKACEKYADGRACLAHLFMHYSAVKHFFVYTNVNHVAVHLRDENGLPSKMRQFLIIENN